MARNKMTIPMALAVPLAWKAYQVADNISHNNWKNVKYAMVADCGSNGNLVDFGGLIAEWGPVVAGLAVHKAAGYFGVNRTLARSKIPVVRV